MFLEFYFLLCIISIIYSYKYLDYCVNPLVTFNILWFSILCLESHHLYGLFSSEKKIYYLLLIGIISFNLGFYIWDIVRKKNRYILRLGSYQTVDYNQNYFVPRYVLLYILGFFCIIYYFNSAVQSIIFLFRGNNLGDLRSFVQSEASTNASIIQKYLNFISVIFLIPGAYVIQVVAAMDFWLGKRDRLLFIIGLLLAVTSSIGEGGRTSLVNFLIYMLLGYSISTKHLKRNKLIDISSIKKRKWTILFIILVFISFLTWFTLSRTGKTLQKNLYLYFSMEPYMFNLWANRVDESNLIGFGEASLNGFSFSLLYIVKNIFNIDFPSHWKEVYDFIRFTDSQWQVITNYSTTANAYVSAFWFFYLDGRLLGIIVGMFTYGIYMAHSFNEAVRVTNIRTVSLYGFIFQGMLYTFIRFPFSNIYYSVAYIMLLLIFFEKRKVNFNNV